MSDRFDEAKRALDGVPARDVWEEAQRRAESDLLPLAPAAGRVRRPARWVAAAAVAMLIVGTIAVRATDDDSPLDTSNGPDGTAAVADVEVFQADGGCKLGIKGEPPPVPAVTKPTSHGGPGTGTQVRGWLNEAQTQTYSLQVPGEVVTDLVGERVADVQLERGTAQLWFRGDGAVQVRWFTGSQGPCESFTVTVGGGNEDENRHAAVELAERVVLPSELTEHEVGDNPLAGTEWFLEQTANAGEVTEVDEVLLFTFTDTDASWNDGCSSFDGPYTIADGSLTIESAHALPQKIACEPDPTSEAVNTVMEGTATFTLHDARLVLRKGDTQLDLWQAGRTVRVPSDGYGIWPVTGPESVVGFAPDVTGTHRQVALAFADRVLGWADAEITDAEPSEDGYDGSVLLVHSDFADAQVDVRVRTGDAPDRSIVYGFDTPERMADPDATASVHVVGSTASASGGPVPDGAEAIVRFVYGEAVAEGPAGDTLTIDRDPDVPGAVLLLFIDPARDVVVGGWGTTLPTGDFTAG
jgi:hypothetical protein